MISIRVLVLSFLMFLICGCDSLRLAPSEQQKQNAWLHNRTASAAAQMARAESASQDLQALTGLCEQQSLSFTSYCGLPKDYPPAQTTQDLLSQSSWQLASTALAQSSERPDPWQVADSMLELGVGILALLGGIGGTRAVRCPHQVSGPQGGRPGQRVVQEAERRPDAGLQSRPPEPVPRNPPARHGNEGIAERSSLRGRCVLFCLRQCCREDCLRERGTPCWRADASISHRSTQRSVARDLGSRVRHLSSRAM
jgi:hypothetical protein